jgi:hypothetical protein
VILAFTSRDYREVVDRVGGAIVATPAETQAPRPPPGPELLDREAVQSADRVRVSHDLRRRFGAERGSKFSPSATLGSAGTCRRTGKCDPRPGCGHRARGLSVEVAAVLSSHSEGPPMVLFETMTAGVSIIATGVGGIPDTLSEADAILVPPENPAALFSHLREVIPGKVDLRDRVMGGSNVLFSRFGMEAGLERHEELYRRMQKSHFHGLHPLIDSRRSHTCRGRPRLLEGVQTGADEPATDQS